MIRIVAIWVLAAGSVCAEGEVEIQGKPLSQWLAQLRGDNRGLQIRAARALAEAPTNARPKIIEQVIPVLKSPRENDKFVAAQTLGEYGPMARVAVPDLLPLLEGTEYERNRAAAAKALGQILRDATLGGEIDEVTAALVKAFTDKYDDVRREAVRACGMIGPAAKACIPHLAERLKEPPGFKPNLVSMAAAWTCQRMGPLAKEHVDLLIGIMHQTGHLTPAYVLALGAIGPVHKNVVPNIVDKMEQQTAPYQVESWAVLTQFGPQAAMAVPYTKRFLSQPPQFWEKGKMLTTMQALKFIQAVGPTGKEALPEVEKLTKYKIDFPQTKETAQALQQEAVKTAAVLKGTEK